MNIAITISYIAAASIVTLYKVYKMYLHILQKLIYLHLSTDCFMKIYLQWMDFSSMAILLIVAKSSMKQSVDEYR